MRGVPEGKVVRPLIRLHSRSGLDTDDLMWPNVTGQLLVSLEPGEVIRWGCTATVDEVRWERRDGVGRPHRAWRLAHADVLITDRRVTYRGYELQKCTCRLAAAVAHLDQPRSAAAPSILAGHVRFQWPFSVDLAYVSGRDMCGITCHCEEDGTHVSLNLVIDDQSAGSPVEAVAADVATGLVSDIARFRLAARARTLTRAQIRQLASQRDTPHPDSGSDGGPRRWRLEGAVRVGASADIRGREDPLCKAATEAFELYQASGDVTLLDRAMLQAEEAGKHQPISAFDEIRCLNLISGALKHKYERYGSLSDLSRCVETQRAIAERVVSEAPELAAGTFSNLGTALIERFRHNLDDKDLTDGVAAHEQAVAATDRASGDFPNHLDGLGLALKMRFIYTRNTSDLSCAIAAHEQALAGTPRRSRILPGEWLTSAMR
jgi:hypothetical protein